MLTELYAQAWWYIPLYLMMLFVMSIGPQSVWHDSEWF